MRLSKIYHIDQKGPTQEIQKTLSISENYVINAKKIQTKAILKNNDNVKTFRMEHLVIAYTDVG